MAEVAGPSFDPCAYSELFALVGAKTPDLRGLFLRGVGGNSPALGVAQGDAIRNIGGTLGTVIGIYPRRHWSLAI